MLNCVSNSRDCFLIWWFRIAIVNCPELEQLDASQCKLTSVGCDLKRAPPSWHSEVPVYQQGLRLIWVILVHWLCHIHLKLLCLIKYFLVFHMILKVVEILFYFCIIINALHNSFKCPKYNSSIMLLYMSIWYKIFRCVWYDPPGCGVSFIFYKRVIG